MEFPFFKKTRKSAQNASKPDAQNTSATSFKTTDKEELSASPALEAAVNEVLGEVDIPAAEQMSPQLIGMTKKLYEQLTGACNEIAGREVQRLYGSKKDNNHFIVAFGDGSCISITFEVATLEELDKREEVK